MESQQRLAGPSGCLWLNPCCRCRCPSLHPGSFWKVSKEKTPQHFQAAWSTLPKSYLRCYISALGKILPLEKASSRVPMEVTTANWAGTYSAEPTPRRCCLRSNRTQDQGTGESLWEAARKASFLSFEFKSTRCCLLKHILPFPLPKLLWHSFSLIQKHKERE